MALRTVTQKKPETPYTRPPPLHVMAVAMMEQRKVLSWRFEDNGDLTAAVVKNNKIVVISDGESLNKITLYESFSDKMELNQGYVIRSYSLRGGSPPYGINIGKDTEIFKSAPVEVSEELRREAEKLLRPISTPTHLSIKNTQGLMTVEGEVVELLPVKKVLMGKEAVPLRSLTLEQDKTRVSLNLWREAAEFPVETGCTVTVTHVKGSHGSYGYRLHSTNFSVLGETNKKEIIGVLGGDEMKAEQGLVKILVEGDRTYLTSKDMWKKIDDQLVKIKQVPLYLEVHISGNRVVEVGEPVVKKSM